MKVNSSMLQLLLARAIDAKTILAVCFTLAFISLTVGLASTLFYEHGLFLTMTNNLPMALLCAMCWSVVPFTYWSRAEVGLLGITCLFVLEQLVAVYFNQNALKGYQYPAILGISMLSGVVATRLARQIRLECSLSFLRKLVRFMLGYFCVEAAVRFIYSPYVQRATPSDMGGAYSLLYRFKYSFFFMESNYVSMALLCLLAVMYCYRDFFRRREVVFAYVLLLGTFSRTAAIPALAQFLFFRWWRHRRLVAIAIIVGVVCSTAFVFGVYLSTPEFIQDPSFVTKLYAFALVLDFLQTGTTSQKVLGMGFGNSSLILGTPVHSIPGTFVFEFGALGTVLFVLYLIGLAKKSPSCIYYLIIPFAIYGISIVGVATSFFLFTLGMLSCSHSSEVKADAP